VRPTADALALAIELMRDEADVASANLLPGDLPIVVLTHFLHRFPNPKERTIELLVRWLWRAAVDDQLSMTNEHLHRAFRVVGTGTEHTVAQGLLRTVSASVCRSRMSAIELRTLSMTMRRPHVASSGQEHFSYLL
jgi:hypothetical protein